MAGVRSALIVLFVSPVLFAQVKSGALTGRVADPSGAVVSGAEINVTNTSTSERIRVSTSSTGDYLAPYLAPGDYSVEISHPGFATFRASAIAIAANQTVRADAVLPVGRVDTVTDAKADVEPLQTDSATVQSAADAAAIAAIPNASRNPFYYAILQEGVIPRRAMLDTTSPNAFGVGYQSRRQFSAFSVNGGSAFTSEILLDGISITGSAWNETAVLPDLKGLSEVRVIQNNYAAEYGHGQGVVTMVTKSGANKLHGDPHFDWRNDPNPQYTFADAMRNLPPGPIRVLNFGLALGGPVVLPRIFDGRNRLFFFAAWERLGHEDSPQWLLRLPTAAERRGDFSATNIPGDDGLPIRAVVYDPFSATPAGDNLYRRHPYPGALVPDSGPYARNIFGLYPEPNRTPDDAFQNGNFYVTRRRRLHRQSFTSRIDYHGGRHSLYGTAGFTIGQLTTSRPFGDASPLWLAPNYGGTSSELIRDGNWYASVGDTVGLAANWVADFRFGVSRVDSDAGSGENAVPFDYATIGMPAAVRTLVSVPGHAPDLNAPPFSGPGRSLYDNKQERQLNQQAAGSITTSRGRWTLKWGGEFRNQFANNTDPMTATASLDSPSGATRNLTAEYITADGRLSTLDATPQQRGLAAASLFAGAAYWSNPGAIRMALSHKYGALYTQNQWQASSNLTLTLGLRWDWQPGPSERYDRMAGVDFAAPNAFGGQGALVFPGTGGRSRNLWQTEWTDWQPRVGFAWRPRPSLVVRGGYGLTYLPTNVGYYTNSQTFGALSFAPHVDAQPFGLDPQGVPAGRFWDNALYTVVPAVAADPSLPQLYGAGSTYFFDRDGTRNGRVHQANLFVERRIGAWVFAVGYAGARGSRLQNTRWQWNSDQLIPAATLAAWRAEYIRSGGAHNPANDLVPNPLQPASGALLPFNGTLADRTIPRRVTLYPYLLLLDSSLQATNGYSNYHSLQLRLSRSLARGLLVRAHYTWSKATDFSNTALQWGQGMDDTSGATNGDNAHMDLRNLANNAKLSYSDQPQRFVLTAVWSPFSGEGPPFRKRLLRFALRDWTFSGTFVAHSGIPQGVGGLDTGSTIGRQNRIAGAPIEVPPERQRWYDGKTTVTLPSGRRITPCTYCFLKYSSDAFTAPYIVNADGSIVNDVYWTPTAAINYGDIRGPGQANLDIRISRVFRGPGRVAVEVSFSMTNALDNLQLVGVYDGNLGSLVTQNDPARGLLPGYGSSSTFGTTYPTSYDRRQFLINMGMHF
jgi:hypothetical protein